MQHIEDISWLFEECNKDPSPPRWARLMLLQFTKLYALYMINVKHKNP